MPQHDDDDWALVLWPPPKEQVSSLSSSSGANLNLLPSPTSTVTFAIQQAASLQELEVLLYEVSTPSSPTYGQHLSFEEVGALVANPQATSAVLQWLHASLPSALTVNATTFGEYITVIAPVEALAALLNASLLPYARPSRPDVVIWRSSGYSLPADVGPHVAAVLDLVDLPPRLRGGPVLVSSSSSSSASASAAASIAYARNTTANTAAANISAASSSTIMTPARLRLLYNMGSHVGSAKATQSIFGTIGQAFAPEDISLFQSTMHLADNPVTTLRNIRRHNQTFCASSGDMCGEASLDLEYLMAVSPRSPTTYWYASSFAPMSPFVDWIVNVSATAHPPLVHSISYGCSELHVSSSIRRAFDTEAIKLGLRGVSIMVASGDDGASQGSSDAQGCGYYAEWPASSAYVTSVGATMGGLGADGPERVCSSAEGSVITSGGGFSHYSPRPAYQESHVEAYRTAVSTRADAPINTSTPGPGLRQGFSWEQRAYPDVSMCGDMYLVAVGGKWYIYSGTSASSPVLAGVVSLSNAQRLAAGLASVGFLNPLLYSGFGSFGNDVTVGGNRCSRAGKPCCEKVGFPAATGWDPVTGVGTVDVAKFLPYSLAAAAMVGAGGAVGVPTPRPSASLKPSLSAKPSARGKPSVSAAPTPAPALLRRSLLPSLSPSPSLAHVPTLLPTPAPTAAPAVVLAGAGAGGAGAAGLVTEYAFFFVVLALTAALCFMHRVVAPLYTTEVYNYTADEEGGEEEGGVEEEGGQGAGQGAGEDEGAWDEDGGAAGGGIAIRVFSTGAADDAGAAVGAAAGGASGVASRRDQESVERQFPEAQSAFNPLHAAGATTSVTHGVD